MKSIVMLVSVVTHEPCPNFSIPFVLEFLAIYFYKRAINYIN